MAENEVIVLDSILQRHKKKSETTLSDDKYFELFTSEQVLNSTTPFRFPKCSNV